MQISTPYFLKPQKNKNLSIVQIDTLLKQFAKEILESLQNLRQYIVAEMTHDDEADDTDGLLAFNFQGMIENLLVHSLTFKSDGFAEEKEWRLFLNSQAYKLPDWVLGAAEDMQGPRGFSETLNFLRNRIEFNITADNISPYVPIPFDDFDVIPIEEIWIGPKSRISKCDLKLYLATKGYNDIRITHSNISYR